MVVRLLKCAGRPSPFEDCSPRKYFQVRGVYSDALYRPILCASSWLHPSWTTVENIERRSADNLSLEDFVRDFDDRCRPLLLTDCASKWPALMPESGRMWTKTRLLALAEGSSRPKDNGEGKTFNAGGFRFTLHDYFQYMEGVGASEDQPLYLFDKEFCAKLPELAQDYKPPKFFSAQSQDLFSLLGDVPKRPHFRWIIVGPKKSGSSFHIDPNATSAWNAVVSGAKRWILFPPDQVPPGVHPSDDFAEVTQSVSLMEWFMNFYPRIAELPPHKRPVECTCRAGEIVYVPHGWWHAVINLEPTIAITQNFVSASNLAQTLEFLRDKREQVSGMRNESDSDSLHARFSAAIRDKRPELAARSRVRAAMEPVRMSLWDRIKRGRANISNGAEHSEAAAESATMKSSNAAGSEAAFSFNF
jgi:hypothetical protein